MTRYNSQVTYDIIKKIHLLLSNLEAGEEIIDYLRSTQPIFMKEVGRYVSHELDKLRPDFNEDFILYVGSLLGAAYIMGFLIAREIDHKIYDGVLDLESLLEDKNLDSNYFDNIIDENLNKGKKHKEIGKVVKKYIEERNKNKPYKTPAEKPIKTNIKKKKRNNIDIDLNEGEL